MLLLDDLPETLLDLAVPHEDINELTSLAARFTTEPELGELLAESVRVLVQDIGAVGVLPELPALPEGLGDIERWFPVYVAVAALPHVRAYHRERGIPEDIARRTLADLGRHIALHHRRRGNGGLSVPGWLRLHFRGRSTSWAGSSSSAHGSGSVRAGPSARRASTRSPATSAWTSISPTTGAR